MAFAVSVTLSKVSALAGVNGALGYATGAVGLGPDAGHFGLPSVALDSLSFGHSGPLNAWIVPKAVPHQKQAKRRQCAR